MKTSESLFVPLRGLVHHVRQWGEPGAPRLFLLHGWGDVSASFQFVVDALRRDWHVLAPDWRGFGLTDSGVDAFWFPDYLADLDALAGHFSPDAPIRLVGHSLGGNVACLYAGARPARVSAVVALDAFGLGERGVDEAPGRMEKWLQQLAAPEQFRTYADRAAFAARLMRDNPRLDAAKAAFLAGHLVRDDPAGGVRVAIAGPHRHLNPVPYRRAEAEAFWRRVRARVCWVVQADPAWRRRLGVDDAAYAAGAACFRDFCEVQVADCGHNMHHDQPERIAALIEDFLGASPA